MTSESGITNINALNLDAPTEQGTVQGPPSESSFIVLDELQSIITTNVQESRFYDIITHQIIPRDRVNEITDYLEEQGSKIKAAEDAFGSI